MTYDNSDDFTHLCAGIAAKYKRTLFVDAKNYAFQQFLALTRFSGYGVDIAGKYSAIDFTGIFFFCASSFTF